MTQLYMNAQVEREQVVNPLFGLSWALNHTTNETGRWLGKMDTDSVVNWRLLPVAVDDLEARRIR
jgi:hypothetical protein